MPRTLEGQTTHSWSEDIALVVGLVVLSVAMLSLGVHLIVRIVT